MERQVYPRRLNPDGTAEAPYDVAGWTLPLQMGVRAVTVTERLSSTAARVERIEPIRGGIKGNVDEAKFFSIGNRANDDFVVLNALQEAGVAIDLLKSIDGPFKPGVFGELAFPADEKARRVLERVLPTVSTRVTASLQPPDNTLARHHVLPSRIGLFQPWVPSMDEGWTRLVLEKYGFKYTTLHPADICAGSLQERVDVLLIPSIEPKTLRDGFAENETEPAYVGGLGSDGAERAPRVPQGGRDARVPGGLDRLRHRGTEPPRQECPQRTENLGVLRPWLDPPCRRDRAVDLDRGSSWRALGLLRPLAGLRDRGGSSEGVEGLGHPRLCEAAAP